MTRLYRGVSRKQDEKNLGLITPSGSVKKVIPRVDGKWKVDGRFHVGATQCNTARAQQLNTGLYGACAVSTSESETVAINFATTKNTEEGYVYVINKQVLETLDVTLKKFPDPVYGNEAEVTIVFNDDKAFPEDVILEKYAVNMHGERVG